MDACSNYRRLAILSVVAYVKRAYFFIHFFHVLADDLLTQSNLLKILIYGCLCYVNLSCYWIGSSVLATKFGDPRNYFYLD